MPLDAAAWGVDALYSCSQKGLGAPSGLAPVMFAPSAIVHRVRCRSFYFDIELLEAYWVSRKYHHTMSSPLLCALHAALGEIDAEGLDTRWARHERHHRQLATALASRGWSFLPDAASRAWSLNAVRVPDGVDDANVRRRLLTEHRIEIGAGLGPLAGQIWRIGLMGAGSTAENVSTLMTALDEVAR